MKNMNQDESTVYDEGHGLVDPAEPPRSACTKAYSSFHSFQIGFACALLEVPLRHDSGSFQMEERQERCSLRPTQYRRLLDVVLGPPWR